MVSPSSLCIAPLIQASTHGAGLQWWHPSETARPPMPVRNGSLPTTCTARRGRTDSPFKITDQSCFDWECSIAQASSQAWQLTHFRGSQNKRSIAPPRIDFVKSHFRSPRQRPRTSASCPETKRAAHCTPFQAAGSSSFWCGGRALGVRGCEKIHGLVILSPFAVILSEAKDLRSLSAQGKLREGSPQFLGANDLRETAEMLRSA